MYNTDIPQRAELPGSARLVRSTVIALAVAAALLVSVVMPAEYGIDPTGIGRVTGLKAMGDIKRSAQATAEAGPAPASVPATAPVAAATAPPVAASTSASAIASATPAAALASTGVATAGRKTDQTSVSLKPGEGVEIKMDMEKGASVQYRWVTRGGSVNFDAHGEASGGKFSVSYKKGKDAAQDEGTLEAAFTGQHGWYWKNRGKQPVTVELSTTGQYASIQRVL